MCFAFARSIAQNCAMGAGSWVAARQRLERGDPPLLWRLSLARAL